MMQENEMIYAALRNWRDLNAILKDLREDQVKHALDLEIASPVPRKKVIERLHERYNTLRVKRERKELMIRLGFSYEQL